MEEQGLYCYQGEVAFLERHWEEALWLRPLSPRHTTHEAEVTKHRRKQREGEQAARTDVFVRENDKSYGDICTWTRQIRVSWLYFEVTC